MAQAVAAGGKELDPVKDYDYEYRQRCVENPFGHHWLLEKKIGQYFCPYLFPEHTCLLKKLARFLHVHH